MRGLKLIKQKKKKFSSASRLLSVACAAHANDVWEVCSLDATRETRRGFKAIRDAVVFTLQMAKHLAAWKCRCVTKTLPSGWTWFCGRCRDRAHRPLFHQLILSLRSVSCLKSRLIREKHPSFASVSHQNWCLSRKQHLTAVKQCSGTLISPPPTPRGDTWEKTVPLPSLSTFLAPPTCQYLIM